MIITKNFPGANITVKRIDGDTVYLENQIRDTTEDWFYWAFCVERAGGRTIKFVFDKMRVGYFGAAVSHNLSDWEWTNSWEGEKIFTYTFAEGEDKVYFAHNMVYSPEMFDSFCENNNITKEVLCKSKKGREVPYARIGNGKETLLITARHHSCESTGNYVIEGLISEYLSEPLKDISIICVPFVDYDGVVDGDQGKARAPFDHNRDYESRDKSLYSSVAAIKELAAKNKLRFAFDFHSPWHFAQENDSVFLVRNSIEKAECIERFSKYFEECITEDALPYKSENDLLPGSKPWASIDSPTFKNYMTKVGGAELSMTLETTYFDAQGVRFSQKRARQLGRCFLRAIRKYLAE